MHNTKMFTGEMEGGAAGGADSELRHRDGHILPEGYTDCCKLQGHEGELERRHRRNENQYAETEVGGSLESDDMNMEGNYNCQYKGDDMNMTKLRCHPRDIYMQQADGQPHSEHSSPPSTSASSLRHPHHHLQHQQHIVAAPQSVINLGRCVSTSLDTLVAAEAAAASLSPTASSTSSASLQHQQHMYALQHHYHHSQDQQSPTIHHHHHHHLQQHGVQPVASFHHGHHHKHNACSNSTMMSSTAIQSTHDSEHLTNTSSSTSSTSSAAAAAANRRDHNIDYSLLFVQLSGTLPTLYRCVSCNKIVSNRWHHANIHRPQSHECPVCGQKFTRRDNMKAHCKIKHADIKDRFFSHYVHM